MSKWFPRLTIARGQTDVWACFYDEIQDEVLLGQYRAILSPLERQQELRYRFPSDRLCYLVTRALVRTVLSRYLDTQPSCLLFAFNAYGRPELATAHRAHRSIRFNISHTTGLIVLGITRGAQVGIDTENLRARRAPIDIADCFFSPGEVAALRRLPRGQQQVGFFDYWTLKEAYIKARGMGLSIPLNEFGFDLPVRGERRILFRPPIGDSSFNWHFTQFKLSRDHLVALCTRYADFEHSGGITIRTIVPLYAEQVVNCCFLRGSA